MRQKFPQYLAQPYQVLWFEPDDLAVFMVFFTLALIYGYIFWFLSVGAPWYYVKLKKKYPRGFLKHSLVITGFLTLKGYPNFFDNFFLE